MDKKLTKNDSAKKCTVELQELQDKFEAILYEHDVWYDYFHWWAISRNIRDVGDIFTRWKKWTRTTYPEYWLAQAFLYENTDREFTLWALCSDIWNVWIVQNLKK